MTKPIAAIASHYRAPLATPRRRLNLKYFNLGLFGLIAVLGVSYLVNISGLTVLGFTLRDLKTQAATLASENMDHAETVSAAESYNTLEARTQKLNMVAVGDVEYLSESGSAVAKK